MTPEEKKIYLLRFQRFQKSREEYFSPKINKALKDQYKQFTSQVKNIGLQAALNKITSFELVRLLRSIYVDAATTYGLKVRADLNQVKGRMPIGFSDRMRELILQYYSVDILNTSEGITQKTKDLISDVFSKAYEQGLGIDDIIKQLEDTELSKARARKIARTETVTAANKGAIVVAKETGLAMNKEWLATVDNRTRHDHRNINGQIVGIDDYFNVGGYDMAQPGDRGGRDGHLKVPAKEVVNCRCTILPIPIRQNGKLVRS